MSKFYLKTNFSKYIVLFFVTILITFFISIAYFNSVEKKRFYEIGGLKVTSIYEVVGERKISKVSQYQQNSVWNKEYKYYGVDSAVDDVQKYVSYMLEQQSFNCDDEVDLNKKSGEVVIYKNNYYDKGNIEIFIKYYEDKYDIHIVKTPW